MCPPSDRLIRSARIPSLLPVLLLAGAAALTGCYKPAIVDGGFVCGPSALCPEGFTCFVDRCHRNNTDGGLAIDKPLDGPLDIATDPPSHDIVTDVPDAPDVCIPRVGLASCTPDNNPCDPVCQTGCCTTQKCSALNSATSGSDADLGCVPSVPTRGLGERCDLTGAGTPGRFDNCSPGLVCIQGNAGNFCLKLCRGDADCGETKCEKRPIESGGPVVALVCGLTAMPCDPTLAAFKAGTSGCTGGTVCYLISSDKTTKDITVCDISSGDLSNVTCNYSRECLPGQTCPPPSSGAESGVCRPVCSHTATPPNACPGGTVCQTLGKAFDACYL